MVNNIDVASLAVSSSLNFPKLLETVKKYCSYLTQALHLTFEAVSNFARKVWGGIQGGGILVDIVLRNLLRLERHINDIAHTIQTQKYTLVTNQLIPFLYDIEAQLTSHMITNRFFYETFGWLVKGILSLIKYIRSQIIL